MPIPVQSPTTPRPNVDDHSSTAKAHALPQLRASDVATEGFTHAVNRGLQDLLTVCVSRCKQRSEPPALVPRARRDGRDTRAGVVAVNGTQAECVRLSTDTANVARPFHRVRRIHRQVQGGLMRRSVRFSPVAGCKPGKRAFLAPRSNRTDGPGRHMAAHWRATPGARTSADSNISLGPDASVRLSTDGERRPALCWACPSQSGRTHSLVA
jgi:hypothetical protein